MSALAEKATPKAADVRGIESKNTYLNLEDLADSARETTLGGLGRALHEHDKGVLVDSLDPAVSTLSLSRHAGG